MVTKKKYQHLDEYADDMRNPRVFEAERVDLLLANVLNEKYNMKNSGILFSAMIATTLLGAYGTGGGKDAKATGDSANKENINSAKLRDTSAAKPVHMADLKRDGEFAVAAADGGMLEVALGKLAVNGDKPSHKQICITNDNRSHKG